MCSRLTRGRESCRAPQNGLASPGEGGLSQRSLKRRRRSKKHGAHIPNEGQGDESATAGEKVSRGWSSYLYIYYNPRASPQYCWPALTFSRFTL
jgi:hypothetical protein